jgi:RHS repeat-associated protein
VKFTGYLLEEEGGQNTYHAEARGYDPVIGRFTSRDPLAASYPDWNPYAYAMNNPMSFIDPSGMCSEEKSQQGHCTGMLDRLFAQIQSSINSISMPFGFSNLMVADAKSDEISSEVTSAAVGAAGTAVGAGIVVTDVVSDVSTYVAVLGIATTPLHGGTLTATALAIGTGADATSLVLKTTDAAFFDGSWEATAWQAGSMFTRGVAGQVVQGAASKAVARTGSSVSGPLFRSSQTGRFVANGFGHKVTAASDATRVVIDFMIPN